MIRRIFFLITTLCMVVFLTPAIAVSAADITTISSLEDLKRFSDSVLNGNTYEGKTINLTADIDMSEKYGEDINGKEVSWLPIGYNQWGGDPRKFYGTFDGGGHTISGIYMNYSGHSLVNGWHGLFSINYGTIINLRVSGSIIGKTAVGGIAGYNMGTIENCGYDGYISGDGGTVGGIAGGNSGIIDNCRNFSNVFSEKSWVGGIVGNNYGTIKNSYNIGEIGSESGDVGGIAGSSGTSRSIESCYSGTIESCYNTGEVAGDNSVGGIAGENSEIIKNCYNTGAVSCKSNMAGGIAGNNSSGIHDTSMDGIPVKAGTIESCYNTGEVSGGQGVGGIAGSSINISTIKSCYNTGDISGDNCIGGITGNNPGIIKNCYNTGYVSCESDMAGGIAGENRANVRDNLSKSEIYVKDGTIENCYDVGDISGKNNVGRIAGTNPGTIKNCYYLKSEECINKGIGNGSDASGVTEMKTEEEFYFGSVTWLLQKSQEPQIWGQKLMIVDKYDNNDYPILTDTASIRVLKVAFMNGDLVHNEVYTNPGHTVSLPANPTPSGKNMIFDKWMVGNDKFDKKTVVQKDLIVTAQWKNSITPENEFALNEDLKVDQKGKKITVKWGKVKDADGYMVYVQYCSKKFSSKPTKTLKSASSTKASVTKINGKKLDLKNNFKVYVAAYKMIDGGKVVLGKTVTAHVVGKNNKSCTNVKQIKLAKSKYTLKVGKTAKIKAKTVLVDKKKKQLSNAHAKEFRYKSTDTKVAVVSSKGKITAKGKGICTIYVYARNGYAKKVKVKVR